MTPPRVEIDLVRPEPTEPLPIAMVIQLLDDQIAANRANRDLALRLDNWEAASMAACYVDAYQCARRWLTGEVLP